VKVYFRIWDTKVHVEENKIQILLSS